MDCEKTAAQAELLHNRLVKRHRHLKKWAARSGTSAYRLYDRDIPEIPLTLDYYGGAVSGAIYQSADEKDETWLSAMKAAIAGATGIDEKRIFIKERRRLRHRQDSENQYGRISTLNFYTDATEGDLRFRVNLSDYIDTGLFLDSRKKRALLRGEARRKRVLNLFAYTCSLSVAAAAGGAMHTDSVDLSNTYLEWGRINFALNKMEARCVDIDEFYRSVSIGNCLIQGDAMRFLAGAARKKLLWDIIILDPPSFSNSKKMSGILDIRRDGATLIRSCLPLLGRGGTLWFSSNAKGFRLNDADFPDYSVKDIGNELVDEDFLGKKTPVCYTIVKR